MNPFICDNSPATRKFIRSRVMLGKNVRKKQPKLAFGSWVNNLGGEPVKSTKKKELQITLPRSVCSELQALSFADRTQPYMLDLVYKFFTILKQSLYPIEVCVEFDSANSVWYEYLLSDAPFLHSLLWTAQAYFDWIRGIRISEKALIHESKAITLLQERLDHPQIAVSDTTIAVVVNLSLTAALVGQFSTARKHMTGLYQILKLRGGLEQLKGNSQLQIKICRADLSIALLSGARPLLLSESFYWKPLLADLAADRELLTSHFREHTLDMRLVNTGADLRKFCNSANIAFLTGSKIDGEIFQETLISVQYRLMALKFSGHDGNDNDEEGKLNEALRLALLTFSNTVFLQIRGIRVPFSILSLQLKHVILSQGVWADLQRLKTVSLWVLFVAAIEAMKDEDDVWLMPLINERLSQTGSLISWNMVRSILKDFIWIDQLHDEDGKAVYSRAVLWNKSASFR